MARKKILCIGGSLNQSQIVYAVSQELAADYDCWYSAYFIDKFLGWLETRTNWAERTPLAGPHRANTERFWQEKGVQVDYKGRKHHYDLVIIVGDIILPSSIRKYPILLVQEGMTDPENWHYDLVRTIGLPRWMGSTSMTGLSHAYRKFCVASEGYRQHFIRLGCRPDRLVVTGIPNFDNLADVPQAPDFPHRHFALVATSDARETAKIDNRRRFIEDCKRKANGRPLIFKLHPNENWARATDEINRYAPGSLVLNTGNIHPMIAHCDVLITQYSSVVYHGIALGKEVYSYFDMERLRRLMPLQNGGTSKINIAKIARQILENQ